MHFSFKEGKTGVANWFGFINQESLLVSHVSHSALKRMHTVMKASRNQPEQMCLLTLQVKVCWWILLLLLNSKAGTLLIVSS